MANLKDLTNKRVNTLTILSFAYVKDRRTYWLCKCDCGNEKIIDSYRLSKNKPKSCGCLNRDKYRNIKSGSKFGNFEVVKYVGVINTHLSYLCKCICGKNYIISGSDLHKGSIKSCGCKRYYTKCKYYRTRAYWIWYAVKQRCYNPNNIRYKYYGGKGVIMCDEWKDNPDNMCEWLYSSGYDENTPKRNKYTLTIDRIDNDGNYEPSNCRLITRSENSIKENIEKRNKKNAKLQTTLCNKTTTD